MKLQTLRQQIKRMRDYLGPRIDYDTSQWPRDPLDRWMLVNLFQLEGEYSYRRIKEREKLWRNIHKNKIQHTEMTPKKRKKLKALRNGHYVVESEPRNFTRKHYYGLGYQYYEWANESNEIEE